jgi:hypothetical protein
MFLHSMRRIAMLIRDNLAQVQQVESGAQPDRRQANRSSRVAKKDPTLAQISAQFSQVRYREESRWLLGVQPRPFRSYRQAAPYPQYGSFRAVLLVQRPWWLAHIWQPRPHESHARECPRHRRERSDVPHSTRPMTSRNWPKSSLADARRVIRLRLGLGAPARRSPRRTSPADCAKSNRRALMHLWRRHNCRQACKVAITIQV